MTDGGGGGQVVGALEGGKEASVNLDLQPERQQQRRDDEVTRCPDLQYDFSQSIATYPR